LGFNKERRAVLVRAVDGNGAARRQRHALRALATPSPRW
jgi:hypothetical protein